MTVTNRKQKLVHVNKENNGIGTKYTLIGQNNVK